MKTQLHRTGKIFFSGFIMISMMLFIASCSSTEPFLNSSIVPAATGNVKVKKDANQNYVIKVQIDDLADVERLQSSKDTYVLWMETDRGNNENLGQLISSTSFFSKQHGASLETITSYKPVRFFVTAENGIDVRYPDSEEILKTNTFN
ncbi:MAG: hypothetical protein ACOC2E_03000 [Bacteroidota bacterium]